MKKIKVFISHSWSYSGHYDTLSKWIFDSYQFENLSIPQDDPIHNASSIESLRRAIYARIQQADVVVIPTGMYATYSRWIGEEINGATRHNKPILAVNPWGQQKGSGIVKENANKLVGWNSGSVIQGIKELY